MAGRRAALLHGPVGPTLLRMAGPMVLGLTAVILINVVDTFYVGQLGTRPLAAMSFTFPVVFLVMSVAMGLGVGMTSVVSRALGENDLERVRRLTTHGLLLANTVVVVVALAGLATIGPVFRVLGAEADLIEMIKSYMVPWYIGVGFLVIPMVGNSAIRATGDTKTPSLIMVIAGVVNIGLDPLFIFGLGPFPRLELQGAAIATLIAYSVTFVASFWILARRERMLDFARVSGSTLLQSWRQQLAVGIPATATNMMIPLAAGVLTRIVAGHGHAAVAAYGVGTRVEALVLIGVSALSTSIAPFAGQNFGARHFNRVSEAFRFCVRSGFVYGVVAAVGLGLGGPALARLFNDDPEVVANVVRYFRIIPGTYAVFAAALVASAVFNATNHPLRSAFIVGLRLFGLAVPLALIGTRLAGLDGIFVAIGVANVIVGIVAFGMIRWFLKRLDVGTSEPDARGRAQPTDATTESPT